MQEHVVYWNDLSDRIYVRWNLDIHIKRKHGRYLLGRSSGLYVTNNSPYSKNLQLGRATIADCVDETFQPRYIPQQGPPQILQNFNPLYR
jgi:hypothetical protein